MKNKLKCTSAIRTSMVALVSVALIASAAVFLGVRASDVSPTDCSGSDQAPVRFQKSSPISTNEAPETLDEPAITLTTDIQVGEVISLSVTGTNVMVDYGNNTPVPYPGDKKVKGSTIRIYGESIKKFNCQMERVTSLDVSKCTSLTELRCSRNPIRSLDVSNNTALTYLDCGVSFLTSLNVSNNTELTYLQCDLARLTSLDVSNNTALTQLKCNNNVIPSLDVSHNTALTLLKCSNNQLTSLDVSNNAELSALSCDHNLISLPVLYGCLSQGNFSGYAPQTHVIPSTVKAGESIDLSSEYSVDGTVTVFKWYDADGNEVIPASSSNGVFTFGDDSVGKKLVCKMTNEKLPEFKADEASGTDARLITTEVTVQEGDSVPEEPDPADDQKLYFIKTQGGGVISSVKPSNNIALADRDGKSVGVTLSESGVHETLQLVSKAGSSDGLADSVKNYGENNKAFYDIGFTDGQNNEFHMLGGSVNVCMQYPEGLKDPSKNYNFVLYHKGKNGVQKIKIDCKSDGIWFEATDFSPYALAWTAKSVGSPGTGESVALVLVMSGLCVLSLVTAGIVLYRRKKDSAE